MDHHLLGVIRKTTGFIEDHLLEDLHLDLIAGNVNFSRYHLLRIWKSATGTGLMEYVRRRRIAVSLGDLLNNRKSIDFISNRYGFGCERTYNRVFKEEFGTTPAKWRRDPRPLNILDRFNPDFIALAGDGLVFLRAISILPEFSIAGHLYKVDIRENRKTQIANRYGNDFFANHRKRIMNPMARDIYIGYTKVPDPITDHTFYQPSLLVDRNSIVPEGMTEKRIAPHKYGVFVYMGLHRPEELSACSLSGLWQFIHETWMPTIRFELKENFHFERIDYARCSRAYCECELYFPISMLT